MSNPLVITLLTDFHETKPTKIFFKSVHMTFQGICYDVKSSKGSQTLRLLHDVSGHFRGGRMCALMVRFLSYFSSSCYHHSLLHLPLRFL